MASVGLLEDNPRIAKLCSTFLHFAGYDVIVYETSQECLQASTTLQQFQFELEAEGSGSAPPRKFPPGCFQERKIDAE